MQIFTHSTVWGTENIQTFPVLGCEMPNYVLKGKTDYPGVFRLGTTQFMILQSHRALATRASMSACGKGRGGGTVGAAWTAPPVCVRVAGDHEHLEERGRVHGASRGLGVATTSSVAPATACSDVDQADRAVRNALIFATFFGVAAGLVRRRRNRRQH